MKLLLDTHVFLWAIFGEEKLSKPAKAAMTSRRNTVYVSPITFWEISLKYSLNKISLAGVQPDELPGAAVDSGMEILTLSSGDLASFHRLPQIGHRDPFDRMLIWQAIQNGLCVVSKDRSFEDYKPYGLHLIW